MKKTLSAINRLLMLVFLVGLHARQDLKSQSINITPPSLGNGQFGAMVTVLPNGNFVITDPAYDEGAITDVGAVYLYNGATLSLISTLTGSNTNDRVGNGGITVLSSGNYVIRSLNWTSGSNADAGAVTWCSGNAGVSGIVSASNSLTGSNASDGVGSNIIALSNGNYVVSSLNWKNGTNVSAGAVTWCSGTTGISGAVSSTNSLIGGNANDQVGSNIIALSNSNYVVSSPNWRNGGNVFAGAVTWGSGTAGVNGVVSTSNSLTGSNANDLVGSYITALSNGNYVVSSPNWKNSTNANAGAVTWGSGTAGIRGVVSTSNSLVGSSANDKVGSIVTALSNGNYVVSSSNWNNGTNTSAGAVTWCNGTTGIGGVVSTTNSLTGSNTDDNVGNGGITALSNGNYVVSSYSWRNGSNVNAGAATWGSGTTGVSGAVSTVNSLVGSNANDNIGSSGIYALSNGNYVVSSYNWKNGSNANAGAATWGNGTTGVIGEISAANSLTGSGVNDNIGIGGITVLTNGNYVVRSQYWTNGSNFSAGAVTWGSGTTGVSGVVSIANSLVGSNAYDYVGSGGITVLNNGNYVVSSSDWTNGSNLSAGAATWGSGTVGVSGVISAANSLVGSNADDYISGSGITALNNGNYVVSSQSWTNGGNAGAGAATWGSGTVGVSGAVSAANSLVGSSTNDNVGYTITTLNNGNYLVSSPNWTNGSIAGAGAVTYANGNVTGPVTTCNSVLGNVTDGGAVINYAYNTQYDYLIVGKPAENLVTRFFPSGQAMAQNSDQATISLSSNTSAVPFVDYAACRVLGAVKPSGFNPVNGDVAAKAFVQGSAIIFNGQALVRRSLEITPAANVDVATATPTLYFTQADFDDYNAINTNGTNLPTGPSDAAGIANIRINQQHGTSPTGLPGSYTGFAGSGPANVLIDPADTSIVWNSNLNRWEVSFDITGFSGFFVYTGSGVLLPLTWLNVSGIRIDKNKVLVEWKVQEQQVNSYTVERSIDGIRFTAIGTFSSKGNGTNAYRFMDAAAFASGNQAVYYRIQQQDADGKMSYSKTVQLSGDGSIENISVYPNPFHAGFTVRSNTVQSCTITDNAGRTLLSMQLAFGANTIQSENWAAGTYFLKTGNGETYKLIKR